MATVGEKYSEEFQHWESSGRGWRIWEHPVVPEPPFRNFPGYGAIATRRVRDDGKRPTATSSLLRRLFGQAPNGTAAAEEAEDQPEPPEEFSREDLVEIQAYVPDKLNFGRDEWQSFLTSVAGCRDPIAFELIGERGKVRVQFSASPADAPILRSQLEASFPEVLFVPAPTSLRQEWGLVEDEYLALVDFGLGREFMRPLGSPKIDPFVALVGVLGDLGTGERGIFQVVFAPVRHPWASNMVRSVSHADGTPFFVNAPELSGGAKQKASTPLYAAVVRLAVRSPEFDRSWSIARNGAAALGVLGSIDGNELVPLPNKGYETDAHFLDILCRQSRRSGMILSAPELASLVHLPSGDVRSPSLVRQTTRSKASPAASRGDGILLGENSHMGVTVTVSLGIEARKRHMHLIGASGTGKSTMLFNLISQDIAAGRGVAVMDPHGDLIDRILATIPDSRVGDVVLVDPSDKEYAIGFNILHAHSDLEKTLLASDLVAIFQRASSAWGDQLESVLRYSILAFLESDRGGSLADLRRFLLEPKFREEFLETVRDPDVAYYWRTGFKQLTGNKSVGSVLTRLETFLSHKAIRRMVSQRQNRLDFADILDGGKIFLAKLSHGLIGAENSYLLGSLIVAKVQQLAMARAETPEAKRRPFFFYIDEFANFVTPSMAEILSGARKYGLGMVLAHHELHQLDKHKEVASAVLAHCYTRVCFRVSDHDARALATGFASFGPQDLQNLETGSAIARIERSDCDFNLSIPLPPAVDEAEGSFKRDAVVTASRAKYGVKHSDIESPFAEVPRVESDRPEAAVPKTREPRAKPEKPQVTPTPPLPLSKGPVAPPADLGIGGAQHQEIQKRLKEGAEGLGFRAVIEKPILEGAGSVDLVLERQGTSIACEISVTTTIDHEVRNVAKCLRAGFAVVAVVAISEAKLSKLQAAVTNSLGPEGAQKVRYFLPDALLSALADIKPTSAPAPAETTNRGYRVKRSYSKLSTEEAKEREEAAIRLIGEAMKRMKKP